MREKVINAVPRNIHYVQISKANQLYCTVDNLQIEVWDVYILTLVSLKFPFC